MMEEKYTGDIQKVTYGKLLTKQEVGETILLCIKKYIHT
jgi:hypothetical protein